jgi:protein TonB
VSGVLVVHGLLVWWAWTHQTALLAAPSTQENLIMASVISEETVRATPEPQKPVAKPVSRPKTLPPVPQVQAQPAAVQTSLAPQQAAPVVQPSLSTPASVASASQSKPAPEPVVLPSSNADYLNNPTPAYPRMSRRLGEEGTVVVKVLINTEGRAEKAEIRTSSGYRRLDETALETVLRWRYVPGKRNGVAEAMWFNVPIRFVLD